MNKYTYSEAHKGLMPWPLMIEPNQKDYWLTDPAFAIFNHAEFDEAMELYRIWLQETPLCLVRDEDIEFFREAREENIDFEVVWYNFGGFDKPDDYGALAIPKTNALDAGNYALSIGKPVKYLEQSEAEQLDKQNKLWEKAATERLFKEWLKSNNLTINEIMNHYPDKIPSNAQRQQK
jgi:hypothetical protein